MTSEQFLEVVNAVRFSKKMSMMEIERQSGRSYQGIRHFFKGSQDTTIYLMFDILNVLGVVIVMDGHDVETHEDALKIIQNRFGDGEYSATAKRIGMTYTALRDAIQGANSKLSTFLKVCDGFDIDMKVRVKE